MKHIQLDARHGLAFTLGILLAIGFVAASTSCTDPTRPIVTCHERVIQTPQGPWSVGQACEATDPVTGHGHSVPSP